jgi:hypothetical protein
MYVYIYIQYVCVYIYNIVIQSYIYSIAHSEYIAPGFSLSDHWAGYFRPFGLRRTGEGAWDNSQVSGGNHYPLVI